jgi:hypothetical protein
MHFLPVAVRLIISRIAADLLSLFSKLFAKSFTNKLLSAGKVDSAVLF